MKVFVHKDGQQLGPFDESKIIEMVENGEISDDDLIFRQGDTEWSKASKFYGKTKFHIVKLTVKTGLIIQIGFPPSDYQPTESLFLKVDCASIEALQARYLEQFYKLYFGETWRSGNSDGSLYVVLDEKIEFLNQAELAKAEWRGEKEWKLYRADGETLRNVSLEEFEAIRASAAEIVSPTQSVSTESQSLLSQYAAMNEVLRQRKAGQIDSFVFIRKLIEYDFWQVPVSTPVAEIVAGATPNQAVFQGNSPNEKVLCFFSDDKSYADYENAVGDNAAPSMMILPGETVFGSDFSEIEQINFNAYSDNAVGVGKDEMYRFNGTARSVKTEKLLEVARKKANFYDAFKEFEKGETEFWLLTEKGNEIIGSTGEKTFPIFTAPDLAKKFKAAYSVRHSIVFDDMDFGAINSARLGGFILASDADKIVFNPYTEKELEYIEDDKLAAMFITGFPAEVADNLVPANDESAINKALRMRNAEEIAPKDFIRKICEYQNWRVPIRNTVAEVEAGALPELSIFDGNSDFTTAVCVFTDAESYGKYTNGLSEKQVKDCLIISGEKLFAMDFSERAYLNLNPHSDNSLYFMSDQFPLVNAMAGSIRIEKCLREFQSGNRDAKLIAELQNHPHYFLVLRNIHNEKRTQTLEREGVIGSFLPIFTSPELFKHYQMEALESENESLEYKLIDGEGVAVSLISEAAKGVVFNPYTKYEMVLDEEAVELLIAESPSESDSNINSNNSLTAEEISIREAIRREIAQTIEPKAFIRQMCEFQTWHLPITNKPEEVIAGETPKYAIFTGNSPNENVLNIFTDGEAVSKLSPNWTNAILTLPGDFVFALELANIDYINVNPFSDAGVNYSKDQFELLNAMAGSIRIEKKLNEFLSGNRDQTLIRELANHPHYFWVNQPNGAGFILNDASGLKKLAVFTSPDLFDSFKKIYCEMTKIDANSLSFQLVSGEQLGVWAMMDNPDRLVFNPLTSRTIEFELEFWETLAMAL